MKDKKPLRMQIAELLFDYSYPTGEWEEDGMVLYDFVMDELIDNIIKTVNNENNCAFVKPEDTTSATKCASCGKEIHEHNNEE